MNIAQLSKTQYYGGLNKRFDKRVRLLQRLGFKYNRKLTGFANGPFERHQIPNVFIMHADKRAWTDRLVDHVGQKVLT